MILQLKDYAGSGVGVVISGSTEQRHAGFIFQQNDKVEILHLAWHFMLMLDTPESYRSNHNLGEFCAYVCDDLLESQAEEVISFLSMIWRRNRNAIPYGIGSDGIDTFFDLDGSVASQAPGEGLTCATFVMSVFSKLGFPVIDSSDWQDRPEDAKWREGILNALRRHPHYQDHADAQERHIRQAHRFRPEEVVGCAALLDDVPQGFLQALESGQRVLHDMTLKGVMRGVDATPSA